MSAAAFRAALPALRIASEPAECAVLSADIAGPATVQAEAVLHPSHPEELASLVRVARREGIALTPRGGGWSYTGGCTPTRRPTAIVATEGLQGLAIDRAAMTVTAGAGMTWGALHTALAAKGLRVPSFGPLSGAGATLGGLAAQNGGFFGAAGHGALADGSLRAVALVDGTGEPRRIDGAARIGGAVAPQPLAGDCGAFGIRSAVTLALMPEPPATGFASFGFATGPAALAGLLAVADLPGLGEAFVFDPGTHANLARTGFSVLETAALASDLLRGTGGLLDRVGGLLRGARAGRAFVADLQWSLHLSCDGSAAAVAETLAEAARRAAALGGDPLPDTLPRVTRARPFRRIKALLGPDGEAWLPLHGVFAPEAAPAGLAACAATLDAAAETMQRHGIRAVVLMVLMGRRVVIEPQLFWPDALTPLHRLLAQPEQVRAYGARPANPAARAAAHLLRQDLTAALDAAGAAHFQIGRHYAADAGLPAGTRAAWLTLKRRMDPDGIMNPGALGI